MTDAKTVPNIILDSGGSNQLTIYTESCEKVYNKMLNSVTPPQSSANRSDGPKDTFVVDLLRIQIRFTVRGWIDSADETKFENLIIAGGMQNFTWKSTTFLVNFEKSSIVNDNKSENDETPVTFTCIIGVEPS